MKHQLQQTVDLIEFVEWRYTGGHFVHVLVQIGGGHFPTHTVHVLGDVDGMRRADARRYGHLFKMDSCFINIARKKF